MNDTDFCLTGYCNCCGAYFEVFTQDDIMCPNCGCEYSDENDFIEVYSD